MKKFFLFLSCVLLSSFCQADGGFKKHVVHRWTTPYKVWGLGGLAVGSTAAGLLTRKALKHKRLMESVRRSPELGESAGLQKAYRHHKKKYRDYAIAAAVIGGVLGGGGLAGVGYGLGYDALDYRHPAYDDAKGSGNPENAIKHIDALDQGRDRLLFSRAMQNRWQTNTTPSDYVIPGMRQGLSSENLSDLDLRLGDRYSDGSSGQDESGKQKAKKWYERAADRGNATALSNLGYMSEQALDVNQALQYYKRAADLGSESGVSALIKCFNTHDVIRVTRQNKNEIIAQLQVVQKAAQSGNEDAKKVLARHFELLCALDMIDSGTPEVNSIVDMVVKGAEEKNPDNTNLQSHDFYVKYGLYRNGSSTVPQNLGVAYRLLTKLDGMDAELMASGIKQDVVRIMREIDRVEDLLK